MIRIGFGRRAEGGRIRAAQAVAPDGDARAATLLVVLAATAGALAFDRFRLGPAFVAALLGILLLAGLAVRAARTIGAHGTWVVLLLLSVVGGELAALPLAGQSGRLLWIDAVLVAGCGVAAWRTRLRIELPSGGPAHVLVPFVAWCLVSLLFARDVLTGIAELKEWLVALAAALVIAAYARDAHRARVVLACVAVVGALIGLAMAVTAALSPYGFVLAVLLKKVDLPFGRSNYLAGLLALALPVALALDSGASRARARLAWLTLAVANAAGLVISASKGAMLAVLVGLGFAYLGGGRAARRAGIVAVVVAAVGVWAFQAGPLQRVLEYRLQQSALDYSAGERMDLYRLAWAEFVRHPLFGIGLNNFSVSAHRLTGVDTVPHNLELGFLAELGLPGLLLALAWVWAFGRDAWRASRRPADPRARALGIGLWAAFLTWLVHNQVESTLYGEQFKLMWVAVAVATWRLALDSRQRQVDSTQPESAGTGARLPL